MITVHGRTRAQGFSGAARMEPIAAVRAALPRDIPVVGNGDVKDVAACQRMRDATGCDAVMIGRGAMGNPWLFRSLAALARGDADPGAPSLAERRQVWRRHAALVMEHSPEKMRLHELRKTLAWYSRGLRGGAALRQRASTAGEPAALLAMGEAFFADLETFEAAGVAAIATVPADPIAKSVARHGRRDGSAHVEAEEPCVAPPRPDRRRGARAVGDRRVRDRLASRHRRRDQHPHPAQRSAGAARDQTPGRASSAPRSRRSRPRCTRRRPPAARTCSSRST